MNLDRSNPINYLLWAMVCGLMIWFKLSYHELWKDEWQAYLVARDMSLGDMFAFLNYEGHPSLWYLFLKATSVFAGVFEPHEETLVQLGHSLLLVATFYVLMVRLDVPLVVKLGLAFSYFFGFQYGIVNRGYILVMLLSLLSAVEIRKGADGKWLALYLFLLCQTEVYGVFLAGVLLLYKYLESDEGIIASAFKNRLLSSSLIVGFLVFVITVFPRGNRDDFTRAYNQELFSSDVVLTAVQGNTTNAFLPGLVADTNVAGWSGMGLLLGLLTLLSLFLIFRKHRSAMLAMGTMLAIMIAFGVLIYSGGIRQWGMTYVLFAVMVCLVADKNWIRDKIAVGAFVLISLVQLVHNGRAYHRDYSMPFSISEQVGEFIKEKVPENVPILVINKFETAAVGAYADRPLYELPSGEPFTYFKWLEKVYIPTQSEIELFAQFKGVGGVVLLSPTPIDTDRFSKAQLWQTFDNPTYKLERMYLYSMPMR